MGDYSVAVCDADNGLVWACLADVGEDGLGRGCIEGRECFIEQEHRRIDEQGAGNGYTLSLSFAQARTAFATWIIEATIVVQDKVRIRQVQGHAHGGVSSSGVAEEEVISDRAR